MKIVKVETCLGSLNKNNGCERSPEKIIEELRKIYYNWSFKRVEFSIDSVEINKNDAEKTLFNIYSKAKNFQEGVIFLGGDHSITYPSFKALSEKYSNPGLLIFDAHPDCEVTTSICSHEDFVRKLIDDNVLKKENLIYVGVRCVSKNEYEFLISKKILVFYMNKLREDFENICDIIMEKAREFDSLYVSIDIDVLDPAFAPGTGCLEPGGLSTRELLYFIQRIRLLKNLKFVDLVEINSDKDINDMTIKLGAKIIGEFF